MLYFYTGKLTSIMMGGSGTDRNQETGIKTGTKTLMKADTNAGSKTRRQGGRQTDKKTSTKMV